MSTAAQAFNSALVTPLTPMEASQAVLECLQAGNVPCLEGDPGIGKSSITMWAADVLFAEKYGFTLGTDRKVRDKSGKVLRAHERPWWIDYRTALHDGVDLTGLPYVDEIEEPVKGKNKTALVVTKRRITRFSEPGILTLRDPRGGVFFGDEINRGDTLTVNSMFSVTESGTVGEYALPETWLRATAINPKDIGVKKMPAALTRRLVRYQMVADLKDTTKYAVEVGWEPVVIAYLRTFPGDLNRFDPKQPTGPNPRSWEYINRMIVKGSANKRIRHAHFAGAIGEDVAVKLSAFIELYEKLPSIDAIMLHPKKADVPTDPGTLYAISAALARRAEAKNFDRIMDYIERLPEEFNVFCVVDAVGRDKTLQHTGAFTNWAVRHQDVTL